MPIVINSSGVLQPPFVETSDIAVWLPTLLKGGAEFSETTHPKKSQVQVYIDWISTQILSRLRSAGYDLPLCVLSGETWPEIQNTYLQYVTMLGVAAWAGKWVLTPAPASPGSESNRGNIFEESFFRELDVLWDGRTSTARFRACYALGTAAEQALTEPTPPMLTFASPNGMADSSHNLFKYSLNKELIFAFGSVFGVPAITQPWPAEQSTTSSIAYGSTINFPLDQRILFDLNLLTS